MSEVEKETFKNLFPGRNLFTFDKGIQITSNFCGGNLLNCVEGCELDPIPAEKVFNKISRGEKYYTYNMWVMPDAWPYMTDTNTGKAGFFFALTGINEAPKK